MAPRYLLLALSAVSLVTRALVHRTRVTVRRRAHRVRRYARNVRPARPNVITGPIPLITALTASGADAPPLPACPSLPWDTRRIDRSRFGLAVLLDLALPRLEVAG
ncbi:hypothetical protein [Nocardiopsis sp. ATB16-24]|uniref:hypothetical protein n=1 Tax=Nocardiopsis sp. ATB16-24 TaxID=3019555 RepID=UPI002557A435|nr:hypothetical protein [Nocardiopsis sp. ATB16-24]